MNQLPVQNQNNDYAIMENVIAKGDLSQLTSEQRVIYYNKVCESIGLNILTRPFQYIAFEGKLQLYASKDCTEQLRTLKGVSITKLEKEVLGSIYLVTAYAIDKDGRTDVSTGAVDIKGISGKALANAYKRAETQSKRRVTLSICGLGFLDESETPDVAGAKTVQVDFETGEIKESVVITKQEQTPFVEDMGLKCKSPVWNKETLVGEGAPHRQELIDAIKQADTIDSLKTLYGKAYTLHAGNLDAMKDITDLKDARKLELDSPKPLDVEALMWLDELEAAEVKNV